MKKLKLLIASCALLLGAGNASAQAVDKTSSVAAWSGGGYTSAQDNIALKENYVTNTTSTGNIFSQTISSLEQGYYKVTLYANAIYTPERGFTSDASDFDDDRVFIFATGDDVTKKTAVPIKYGIITTGSEAYTVNAYVGADGNLTIGMVKDKVGTNWHTIATKSLYFYGNDLSIIKAELNTEISTAEGLSVASSEEATLNAAIDAARDVYNSGTATFDEIDAAITTLKIAEKYAQGGFSSATLDNPVLTSFMVNGDFTSFTNDWPNGGWFTTAGVGNHGQMTEGSEKAWENYSWGNERLSGKMYFRMTDIPNGAYSVSIDGFGRTASSTYVYANKERVYLTADGTYETKVIPVIVKNNILEVGEYAGKIDWMKIKNVSVSYTGDPLASYKNTIATLIETGEGLDLTGIPTSVSDALSNAISTYKPAYAAYTEEDECTAAVSALQTSVQKAQAYINAKGTVDKINNILDNTNVYTTDAYNTLYAYITRFNNAEYTNEEANALNGTIFGTGWHTTAAIDDFLVSAWDVAPRTWDSYHVNTWSTEGESDGSNFKVPFIEYWTGDGDALGVKTMTATINGLEDGLYKVSAWVRVRAKNETAADDATGITMDVNGGDPEDVTEGTQVGATQFQMDTYTATGYVINGTLRVNFNIADGNNISWLSFKDVKYTRTGDLPAGYVATADDYDALNIAIAAHTLGFEDGEYAPYNNVAAATALAAAKAINQAIVNKKSDVNDATTALTSAMWTANVGEVNAVYDGTFAAATNNGAPAGWTMSNNTLGGEYHSRTFVGDERLSEFNGTNSCFFQRYDGTNSNRGSQYYYGNTTGYTMPLKAATTYRVTVDFANWNAKAEKPLTLNVDGPNNFNASQTKNSSKDADTGSETPDKFDIIFTTTEAGNYVLRFQVQGSDDNAHNVVVSNIELKKIPATVSKTITAAGWATYCSPYALDLEHATGLTDAYIVTGATGSVLSTTSVKDGTIPANTGILIEAAAGTVTIPVVASSSTDVAANKLVGVTANTNIAANAGYVLMNETAGVGFYQNANAFTVGANTAYLPASFASGARSAYFFGGEITGVANVEAAAEAKAQDGKFIENGKIVIVKNGKKFNANGQQVK